MRYFVKNSFYGSVFIFIILIFFEVRINSQCSLNFTQFYLQNYYYNPSLFGKSDNSLGFNVVHRQFSTSNFSNKPNTQNIGFDKSWGDEIRFGFGGQLIRDIQGQAFENSSYGGGLSFSFGKKHSFGFGLATYYNNNIFNPTEFENMQSGDIVIESGRLNNFTVNPSFGLNYNYNNPKKLQFQLGFASTNMYDFKNKPKLISPIESILNQYNFLLKIRFGNIEDFNLNMFSIYRANGGFESNYLGWSNYTLPNSWSTSVLFNLPIDNNKFSLGVGYNTYISENNILSSSSLSPILMINLKDIGFSYLNIGLAYDYSLTAFQQLSNGTFEISLSGSFGGKNNFYIDDKEEKIDKAVEEKNLIKKQKVKDLGVHTCKIKNGDNYDDHYPIVIENGKNKETFRLTGKKGWDNGIGGFEIMLEFKDGVKIPSEICYNLQIIKPHGSLDYEIVSNEFANKRFSIDKGSNNNYMRVPVSKNRNDIRYLLEIYNCKNPTSKIEIEFMRSWK